MYDFLNLDDLRNHNNLFNDLFNYLRDFNYFFYDSWDDYHLFNNFLNFDNFWHFNKFLDNFFDQSWDSFDSFDYFLNWNNSVFDDFNDFRLFNKVVNNLFDFLNSVLVENFGHLNFDFFVHKSFNDLDNWLFDDFLLDFNNFLNNGYLNYFLDDLFDSPILHDRLFNNSFDIFDPVSVYNFLNNNLDLNRFFNNVMNLDNLLYDSGNLDDFLDDLDDRYNFFDDSINRFISDFNVVSNVWSRHIFDSFDYLLYYFFNFDYFWNLDSDFDNFLNNLIDRNGFFDDLFCGHNFLSDKFDVPILSHWNNDFFLDFSVPFDFNWNFNSLFNFNNFRYFTNNFDDFFYNFRYFNDSLFDPWNFNELFNHKSFESWNLNGNIDGILNDFVLFDFDWSLDSSFDFNNSGDFNDFFNNFFDDFFYFNDFGGDSVYFKDIIDINNVHNFLSNHSNDSLIYLRDDAASKFHFFHFFEKGLDQDSEMELDFPGLLTGVSINIFDFNNLRYIFHDFNNSVKLVNFHDIDKFLAEKLWQARVHLIVEFGILCEKFFVVGG